MTTIFISATWTILIDMDTNKTEENKMEQPSLIERKIIKDRVSQLWSAVFTSSATVLRNERMFGFSLADVIPDPNIHQILSSLRAVGFMLDQIIDWHIKDMDHDDVRSALNARESLRSMENVAIALQANDEVKYNAAIEELERQFPV